MGNDTQNNEEQLEMLLMTLGEVDHGICLFRSERQAEWVSVISKRLGKEKVIVHNIADDDEKNGMISSKDFRRWASEADAGVVIVYNMQLLGMRFGDEEVVAALNFMRDQIFAIGKLFVFGVTPYFDLLLSRNARDLYSCILYHFIFQDAEERNFGIPDFDRIELSSDDALETERYYEMKNRIQTHMEEPDIFMCLMCMESWSVIRENISYQEKEFIAVIAEEVDKRYTQKENVAMDVRSIWVLAKTWVELERAERSEPWYQKALETVRSELGEEHEMYADALIAYMDYYRAISNYTICERFCDQALKIYSDNGLEYSAKSNYALQQKAILYRMQAKYEEALKIYLDLLNYQMNKFGEKYYGNAYLYNNIGKIYQDQGNLASALQQYKKALELFHIAGKQGGQIEAICQNMCVLYLKSGDGSEAWKYIKKAKKLAEDIYGKESSSLIGIYSLMASVWRVREQPEKELEYLEKAIGLIKKTHMEESETAAYVYHNLGSRLSLDGDAEAAIRYLSHAIRIWERIYGEKSELTANSYEGLARVLHQMSNDIDAKTYMKKARNIYVSLYGSRDERVKNADEFLKQMK